MVNLLSVGDHRQLSSRMVWSALRSTPRSAARREQATLLVTTTGGSRPEEQREAPWAGRSCQAMAAAGRTPDGHDVRVPSRTELGYRSAKPQ